MKKLYAIAFVAATLLAGGAGGISAVRAADLKPAPAPVTAPVPVVKPYEFTMLAYGWAAGLKGTVASLPPLPAVDVDIGFDKVLKNFEGGIMGAAELRFGHPVELHAKRWLWLGSIARLTAGGASNEGHDGKQAGQHGFTVLRRLLR